MEDETVGLDTAITDREVYGMVEELEPDWRVESIERSDHGTDFVAFLIVRTSEERRQVVLKALTADHMPSAAGRAEPRMLDLAASETAIPVPTVFGYCDDHPSYSAPFYLMEFVEGENFEGREEDLSSKPRTQLVETAGRNLAEFHDLGPVSGVGRIGYIDGQLQVIDPENRSSGPTEMVDILLDSAEETLDSLLTGGYFPELADDTERFADLVPSLRRSLRETLPALSEPDQSTYCHGDYRYGNLLVDPDTGETRAVIDWGQITALEPAHNIAYTESMLLSPERDGARRTSELRNVFRTAYTDARDEWTFDEPRRERIRQYQLLYRLDAMACLPLWQQDATPAERDEREQEHREFVAQYL